MRRIRRRRIDLLRGLGAAFIGIVGTAAVLYVLQSQSMPDLAFWHEESFASEVVPELESLDEVDFAAYQAHEQQIFTQLSAALEQEGQELPRWHRYHPRSHEEWLDHHHRWNRSQLFSVQDKAGAALMVHGLSDSPYSNRALAQALAGENIEVLNLRLPGHGTTPGSLQHVRWPQWRDAVTLGAQTLAADLPAEQPFILVGYSTGAVLAVDYSVKALRNKSLRAPDLLVLISPAMRVSPLAAFAKLQSAVAELPGLEKLDWTEVLPEYDPHKYNSFPLDAAREVYQLSSRVQGYIEQLRPDERENFPRILAFQSVVDATVPPASVVTGLMQYLDNPESELVLFDINDRYRELDLLRNEGDPRLLRYVDDEQASPFAVTALSNRPQGGASVSILHRPARSTQWQHEASDLDWPEDVFSLSHLALPFAPDDLLYGDHQDGELRPGQIVLRGEQGVSVVPMELLARLRYNPFYDFLQQQVIEHVRQLEVSAAR